MSTPTCRSRSAGLLRPRITTQWRPRCRPGSPRTCTRPCSSCGRAFRRDRAAARAPRHQGAPGRARRHPRRRGERSCAGCRSCRSRTAEDVRPPDDVPHTSSRGRSLKIRCRRELERSLSGRRVVDSVTRLLPRPSRHRGVRGIATDSQTEESPWVASRSPPARHERPAVRRPLPARRPRLPDRPRRHLPHAEGGEDSPRPVAGELAAGRNPADCCAMVERPAVRTFGDWAEAYRSSRVDLADETTKNLDLALKAILPTFGDRDPATITPADVQAWIGGLDVEAVVDPPLHGDAPGGARLRRRSTRTRPGTVGSGCRASSTTSTRRPRAEVDTIIATCRRAGGCRSGCSSRPGCGRRGCTRSVGRRRRAGLTVPGQGREDRRRSPLGRGARMAHVRGRGRVPARGSHPERQGVPGLHARRREERDGRACKAAGIVARHPHDLRHRYASVQIGRGRAGDDASRRNSGTRRSP